ncbi:MAG: dTMP kinase, partial [Clostridia bacterium]|nr:dTMP kinase [Clostridia bacterium]
AYQGKARNLGYKFIEEINSFVLESCMPDVTIFLDLSPEQAFLRKGGADITDRLETSGTDFHRAVYKGYLELAEKYKDRIVRIDASGSKAETHAKIIAALKEKGVI